MEEKTGMRNRSVISNYWFVMRKAFSFSKLGVTLDMTLKAAEFFLESFSALWVLYHLIDIIERGGDFAELLPWIVGTAAAYMIYFAVLKIYDGCMRIGCDAEIRRGFDAMLFDKASAMDMACFDDPVYYAGYNRALYCIEKVIRPLMTATYNILASVVMLVNTAVFLCTIEAWMLVSGVFAIGIYRLGKRYGKLRMARKKEQLEYERRQDYVRRICLDRSYAQELRTSRMMNVLNKIYEEATENKKKVNRSYGKRLAVLSFWNTVCSVDGVEIFCYGYAALRILLFHNMSVAELAVIFAAVIQYSSRLRRVMAFCSDMLEKNGYVDALRDALEMEPKIRGDQPCSEEFDSLEFRNVSFRYGETDVLRDVSFRVKSGQTVMIAGLNGAGKSTLAKLMMRLYDPCQGEILYNGKSIAQFLPSSYRNRFSYMPQDFQVYDMSVGENIRMREKEEEDTGTLLEAVEFSGADRWLAKSGKGLGAQIGRTFDPDGLELSGGQKQSLALARLRARKADIYVLDEPSSAMDPIAETQLFRRLREAAGEKTTIFISHRLISAKYADLVLLLDHGHIAECGSHKELMQRKGLYAELYTDQASSYQEEPA